MRIIYTDGGTLDCSSITICNGTLYADDIYIVPIIEIDSIED